MEIRAAFARLFFDQNRKRILRRPPSGQVGEGAGPRHRCSAPHTRSSSLVPLFVPFGGEWRRTLTSLCARLCTLMGAIRNPPSHDSTTGLCQSEPLFLSIHVVPRRGRPAAAAAAGLLSPLIGCSDWLQSRQHLNRQRLLASPP